MECLVLSVIALGIGVTLGMHIGVWLRRPVERSMRERIEFLRQHVPFLQDQ